MDFRRIARTALWSTGLYLMALIIPLVGQAVALFTPVPVIVASVTTSRREGLAALGISLVVIAFLVGGQAAAFFVFGFGLMAVGTAEGMVRQLRPERAALLGGILPVVALSLLLLGYVAHIGMGPLAALEKYLLNSIAETAEIYRRFGYQEMADGMNSHAQNVVTYLIRFMPSFVLITSVVQAALCYGVAKTLIIRKYGSYPGVAQTTFAAWHAPDAWVWGLIVSLLLLLSPVPAGKVMGWNATLLFTVLYLIQGLSLAEHGMRKLSFPALARGLIHTIILLIVPVMVVVIAMGVVDIWADFRKVRAGIPKTS